MTLAVGDANLAAAESASVHSTGAHGEDPSEASLSALIHEEIDMVKAMNATTAIVMHGGGDDWSAAQISGLIAR